LKRFKKIVKIISSILTNFWMVDGICITFGQNIIMQSSWCKVKLIGYLKRHYNTNILFTWTIHKLKIKKIVRMETVSKFSFGDCWKGRTVFISLTSILYILDIVSILCLWYLAAMIWHIQTDKHFSPKVTNKSSWKRYIGDFDPSIVFYTQFLG